MTPTTQASSGPSASTGTTASTIPSPPTTPPQDSRDSLIASSIPSIPPAAPSFHPPAPHHHHNPHGLLPALHSLISIIVIAVFIITFSVQPFRIPSESMEPTLLVGDFLLVNKQSVGPNAYHPGFSPLPDATIHRGDVIVFHYPVDPSMHLVKRVVGLPGDHIKLREGHVFLSGRPLAEPYAVYRPSGPDNFRDNFPRLQSADPDVESSWWIRMHALVDHGELTVPEDSYFVLGDNRNDSEDSRYWGFVPRADIVGKPLLIYFSLRNAEHESISLSALPRRPQPRQERPSRALSSIMDFARWDRTLQVVR